MQRSKHALWAAIDPTSRGGSSSIEQRGRVEEAQVALEACAPDDLDFGALQGTWRCPPQAPAALTAKALAKPCVWRAPALSQLLARLRLAAWQPQFAVPAHFASPAAY